jgi:pyruvate dehydrogenase E1 component beta subunit
VTDPAWKSFGAAAEIVSVVTEQAFDKLKAAPIRITHPDSHTPMSQTLEAAYYPNEPDAVTQIKKLF